MRLRYGFSVLGLASFLALCPATTQAQAGKTDADTEEQARAHFRLGRAHYDNGDFAQAGIEFEEAYRISQRAALLYNIYLAHRDANDTRKAADALRKYLQLEKNIENRGQLESKLAALDRAIAAEDKQAASTPTPTPPPAATTPSDAQMSPKPLTPAAEATPPSEPQPAPVATTAEAPPKRGSAFPVLPVVLMSGGGAMMVGSVVTGLMAVSKHSEWDDARKSCLSENTCALLQPSRVKELNAMKSSGETLATVTDILLFGGIAAAGTGLVFLLLDVGTPKEKAPGTTAGLACVPGACQANLRASF